MINSLHLDSSDHKRDTGRTSNQMKTAPTGALYIWVNHDLGYPKRLAAHLDREDLVIVAPTILHDGGLKGRDYPAVVLDHATRLNSAEWSALMDALMTIELKQAEAAIQ